MTKLTKTSLKEQLDKYNGNISAVARYFSKSRPTIYSKIEKYDLNDELEEAREKMLDIVESKLYQLALAGDMRAIKFFLETQGKTRGYGRKSEIDLKTNTINVTLKDD